MTQTYDPTALATSNRDRVRFEIADTEVGRMYLEDEEIDSILTIKGDDIGLTVLACLDNIIGKLSEPSFRVDWMQETGKASAASSRRKMRTTKAKEFGLDDVSGMTVTIATTYPTRRDAYDYDEAT